MSEHYRAYLAAMACAEDLHSAHVLNPHRPVGFHIDWAERHFAELAALMGYRVEKIAEAPAATEREAA